MRVLAPQIKEINDKYPGQDKAMERQRLTMDLYSKAEWILWPNNNNTPPNTPTKGEFPEGKTIFSLDIW